MSQSNTKGPQEVVVEGTKSITDPQLKAAAEAAGPVAIKPKRKRKSRAKKNLPAVATKPPAQAPQPVPNVPPADAAGQYLALIERSLTDPSITPEKLHSLLDFQIRVLDREKEAEFNQAYMNAKAAMPRVEKDGKVEYLIEKGKPEAGSKEAFRYTKYETLDKAIKPIEKENGFERRFTCKESASGRLLVTCTLIHKNGHFITSEIPVAFDSSGGKNNTQAAGSAFSYGKRYTSEMIWDIVKHGADDDGAASENALIDEAQFKAMQDLIDEWKIDTARFVEHLGVPSLKDIPNKMYPKAMSDLKDAVAKRKKKNAAGTAAKQGRAPQ